MERMGADKGADENGLAERKCSVCSKTETKKIDKLGENAPEDTLILKENSKLKLDKEKKLLKGIYVGTISESLIKEFISYTHGETVIVANLEKNEEVTGDTPIGTGNYVVLGYQGKLQDYYYAVVLGDGDGNGVITASDARIALRISAKIQTASDAVNCALDVNSDGKVTAADARIILRVSAKLQAMPGTAEEKTTKPEEKTTKPEEKTTKQNTTTQPAKTDNKTTAPAKNQTTTAKATTTAKTTTTTAKATTTAKLK